ncbi:hypothetical protein [Marivita sp.]|uniref:hypothetical protein n=1 Tax=Marivita sp. TaxID=2003365 RepID=UPI003A845A63
MIAVDQVRHRYQTQTAPVHSERRFFCDFYAALNSVWPGTDCFQISVNMIDHAVSFAEYPVEEKQAANGQGRIA